MRMDERKRPSPIGTRRGGAKISAVDKEEGKDLDLSGMTLDSLPSPTLNLAVVTKLDLSNNNLESIPESLVARLLNVVVLDLHSNQLRTLPNSMGCLSKLRVLNVSGNMLESLPKSIEDCRALEELVANFNKLTALPDTMGFELTNLQKLCNLSRLEILNVSQNFQYLRSLPPAIGLLTSLIELDISYNSIAVLPDSLSCLGKLRKLQAEGNPLVSPPMDVVEQSLDAVRQYLTARMNGRFPPARKKSWLGRLVKCGTFPQAMIASDVGLRGEDGLSMPDYRTIDGTASPRYVGLLSPRRLFSPRNSPGTRHGGR
ncbi:unnamed protein product [Spirodela intermedia]|uniref:Uncharacterized protein n=1 Tax=Spirodela intermedia TaxID=51605 RepID=A0A7I8JLW9_SPIIN|nr:unnamed protein product [Spirodela intermedia]CAA6671129.1 unnamed protein product [Spirodela intermedia]